MALPTSGPLSLNDIKGEFGGPTSPSLGDYYAGGSYVPSGTSGTNGPVPSSGEISISNFYGTSASVPLSISISPSSLYNSRSGGGSLTSSPATGTGSGGTAPYTYAWTYVSGNSYTINSPSSASTTFTTSLTAGQLKSGVYRCTVTDSLSATASDTITVEMESI